MILCFASYRSPDSTNCTAPDEGAMMLPDDGYWQSNLYSEQVGSCVASSAGWSLG